MYYTQGPFVSSNSYLSVGCTPHLSVWRVNRKWTFDSRHDWKSTSISWWKHGSFSFSDEQLGNLVQHCSTTLPRLFCFIKHQSIKWSVKTLWSQETFEALLGKYKINRTCLIYLNFKITLYLYWQAYKLKYNGHVYVHTFLQTHCVVTYIPHHRCELEVIQNDTGMWLFSRISVADVYPRKEFLVHHISDMKSYNSSTLQPAYQIVSMSWNVWLSLPHGNESCKTDWLHPDAGWKGSIINHARIGRALWWWKWTFLSTVQCKWVWIL